MADQCLSLSKETAVLLGSSPYPMLTIFLQILWGLVPSFQQPFPPSTFARAPLHTSGVPLFIPLFPVPALPICGL